MEEYNLEHDTRIFYITATSFPEGIAEAHRRLHGLLPSEDRRNFFGLSRPENKTIVYHVGVAELYEGEGQALGCKTMIVKKGSYISRVIKNYAAHTELISETFQLLLADARIEKEGGYCVEMYEEPDVRCMVKLNQK